MIAGLQLQDSMTADGISALKGSWLTFCVVRSIVFQNALLLTHCHHHQLFMLNSWRSVLCPMSTATHYSWIPSFPFVELLPFGFAKSMLHIFKQFISKYSYVKGVHVCLCVYVGHFLCIYVDAYFFLKPNPITMSYWKLKQINRAMCLHSKVLESGELLRCLSSGWGGVWRITESVKSFISRER